MVSLCGAAGTPPSTDVNACTVCRSRICIVNKKCIFNKKDLLAWQATASSGTLNAAASTSVLGYNGYLQGLLIFMRSKEQNRYCGMSFPVLA